MATLIIMRGLPGSGKSTRARKWIDEDPEHRARVNRDELRKLIHNGKFIKGSKDNPGTEQTIIKAQLAMAEKFLKSGLDVVDDNTNLPNRSVKQLVEVAEKVGAEWEIIDLTDTPINECILHDSQREQFVGEEVITNLYKKFIQGKGYPLPFEMTAKPEFEVQRYEPDLTKPSIIICDIDGTVAQMDGRSPYDYTRVSEDLPVWPVIHMVNMLRRNGLEVIFLSGRKAMAYEDTMTWLNIFVGNVSDDQLFTRGANDNRADYLIKYELFNEHIREKYYVRYVLDDRNQVVEMWRSLGLTCLQVAEGNF